MNKEEMLNKIIEMIKEGYELSKDNLSQEDLIKVYIETKANLETIKAAKELEGGTNE